MLKCLVSGAILAALLSSCSTPRRASVAAQPATPPLLSGSRQEVQTVHTR
ncbi:MAG TPA: hypothetical protein VHY22_01530 [Chthoniobacteraceae bacterium]|nr:hypothetical protein [Chthoniobacteraceae bacterium]